METTKETTDRAVVLAPAGRLDFGAAAGFQDTLEKTIAEAAGSKLAVVVDCATLDYVSSAGLRSFLVGARSAQSRGVKLVICALQKSVNEVFDVSGFSRILPPMADRATALASL